MILFKTKLRCCSVNNNFKKLKMLGKTVFIKVMHFMMVQYQDSRKKSTSMQIIVFPIKVFSKWCTFLHLRVTGFILCIIHCWGPYFMELQIPFHGHVINFFQFSVTSLRYCCILHINGMDRVRERLISLESFPNSPVEKMISSWFFGSRALLCLHHGKWRLKAKNW